MYIGEIKITDLAREKAGIQQLDLLELIANYEDFSTKKNVVFEHKFGGEVYYIETYDSDCLETVTRISMQEEYNGSNS